MTITLPTRPLMWISLPLIFWGLGVNAEPDKSVDPDPIPPPAQKVPAELLKLGTEPYFSRHAFIADKAKRTLYLWRQEESGLRSLQSFPMDMGKKNGDKTVLGDKRTPEGIYFFQKVHQRPYLNYDEYGSMAFTMDYPNFFDILEGKTGSGIWLHGIPDTKSLYRGSRGCLVVRDEIIKSLKHFIDLRTTPIVVQDEITYVDAPTWRVKRSLVNTWVESWKNTWQSQNIDSYIDYYAPNFKALGMNRNQWREYKDGLNQKYEFIKVRVQDPIILSHDGEYVVRFLQHYESNTMKDHGEKTLYVKRNSDDKFQIVGETWKPVRKELIADRDNHTQQQQKVPF